MTEIDSNVKMPEKNNRQQSTAKDAGDPSFYKFLPTHYKDKAQRWSQRYFNVIFSPTPEGETKFGFTSQLIVPQLLKYADAVDLRDYLAKLRNDDIVLYGFVELVEFRLGAHIMGGHNYVFNPRDYEPEQWGGAHPVGMYDAKIINTSVESNSKNTGGNFVVEFQTNAGTIKKYYSLWHETPKTVEGAHKQLAALCHAIQYFNPINMQDGGSAIRGGQCKIEVGRQKPDEPDNTYVEIKKVYLSDGSVPGAANKGQQNNNAQQPNNQGGFNQGGQNNQGQGGFNQGQGQPQGGFGGQGQGQGQGGFSGQGQGGFGGGGQQPDPNQGQGQGGGFGNNNQQQNNQGNFGNQQQNNNQGQGGFGGNQQQNNNQQGWQQNNNGQGGGGETPSWMQG